MKLRQLAPQLFPNKILKEQKMSVVQSIEKTPGILGVSRQYFGSQL